MAQQSDDDKEFEAWKAKRRASSAPADTAAVTDDDAEYSAWKAARATTDSTPRLDPARATAAAPAPTPAPRRGIAGALGELVDGVGEWWKNRPDRQFGGGFTGGAGVEGRQNESIYERAREDRSIERPSNVRMQSTAEYAAEQRQQPIVPRLDTTQRADVTDAAGIARTRGPSPDRPTQTVAEDRQRRLTVTQNQQSAAKANSSPEKWAAIAEAGMRRAAELRAAGDEDQANEIERKARNARLLSENSAEADTFSAIALSNLLGIVSDPYEQQRRNIAEASQPGATFSPEETAQLGQDRVSTQRSFDTAKDLAAPLVGQLPVFIATGAAGRVATGAAGAFAEARGARSIGQALTRISQLGEETAFAGPAVPVRSIPLAQARIAEEVAQFRAAVPAMVARGVTEGQAVGAVLTYKQARDQGASVEDAIAAAAEGVPINILMGVAGETLIAGAGKALGLGFDPVGRVIRDIRQGVGLEDTRELVRPVDRRSAVEQREIGAQRANVASALDQILGEKIRTSAEAGPRVLGPEEPEPPMVERAGFRTRGTENTPLRSQREIAQERAGRPIDDFNAVKRMERERAELRHQIEAEANDPNLQLELAAQQAPDRVQGPRTLRETLADVGPAAEQGDELAGGYTKAINDYVDALAAVKDSGENGPNTKASIKLARARAALNAARQQYGAQLGASAVLALAAADDDLTEEEQAAVGLAAVPLLAGKRRPAFAEAALRRFDPIISEFGPEFALHPDQWTHEFKRAGVTHGEAKKLNALLNSVAMKKEFGAGEPVQLSIDEVRAALTDAEQEGREPLYSRLRNTVSDTQVFGKKFDEAQPASTWRDRLVAMANKGQGFSKKELEQILPALDEAAQSRARMTRADVLTLVEERVPRIERLTLSDAPRGRGDGTDALRDELRGYADIIDINDINDVDDWNGPPNLDHYRDQIAAREQRNAEITEEINDMVTDAARDMERASARQGRMLDELKKTFENMKLRDVDGALDTAERYISENSQGDEWFGDRSELIRQLEDDFFGDREVDHEQLLKDNGYTIEEEPTFRAQLRTRSGDEEFERVFHADDLFSDEEIKLGGMTVERAKEKIAEEYGYQIDAIEEDEPMFVVRDRYGERSGYDTDKDEAMADAVKSERLSDEEEFNDYRAEVESDIERLIETTIEYTRASEEHSHLDDEPENHPRTRALMDEKLEYEREVEELQRRLTALQGAARAIEPGAPAEGDAQLTETAQRGLLAAGADDGPTPVDPDAEFDVPTVPRPKGTPAYATVQRINQGRGARDYREVVNVVENQRGDPYNQNHYASSRQIYNAAAHFRAEVRDWDRTPGVSGEKVEYTKGEPETIRVLKSQIGDVRKKRNDLYAEANAILNEFEALPKDKQGDHSVQVDYLNRIKQKYQHVTDQAMREEELTRDLREAIGKFLPDEELPDPVPVHIKIESQSDLAQDATKLGVRPGPDEIARLEQEYKAAVDRYEEAIKAYQQRTQGLDPTHPENRRLAEAFVAAQDAKDLAKDALNDARAGVPESPFTDTAASAQLNMASFALDVAERDAGKKGNSILAWSDSMNRMVLASLKPKAAKLQYDELAPSAIKRLLGTLGFKDVEVKKLWINGFGHWYVELTPEMRRAIRKYGFPVLGVMAMAPATAEAQGEGATSVSPYASALGGIAVGAALMYAAQHRSARRLLHENRELARVVEMDDLSGLANKRAWDRARANIDADENYGVVAMDGDKFGQLNKKRGHSAGDKAIRHFGEVLRQASVELDIPLRAFRKGGDEFVYGAPKEKLSDLVRYVEMHSEFTDGDVKTRLSAAAGDTFEEADAALIALKEERRKAVSSPGLETASQLAGGAALAGLALADDDKEGAALAAAGFGITPKARKAFKKWFGRSHVVDADGAPLRVYHGTTGDFSVFDPRKANIESDWGKGFYFSNTPDDVANNYASSIGPDLIGKIDRRAEQILSESQAEYGDAGISSFDATEQAKQELGVEHEGATMPVFLKIEKPVILGGPDETKLTFESNYDADADEYGAPSGTLVDFIDALDRAANRYDGADVSELRAELEQLGFDYEQVPVSKVIEAMKKHEGLSYATDERGDLASHEIIREAFEEAGFDGVIDKMVDVKFGSQRRVGQSMKGMNRNTVHYIAFRPEQIKSATGNRGTFDGTNPNILYSNPVGPALRAIRRQPTAASIAALGVALSQSDDEDLKNTSPYMIGLAALSAIGSGPLIAGKDALVKKTVEMMKNIGGESMVRAFNPDALLDPSVKTAIEQYEKDRARAVARAREFSAKAKALGPEGDRAVSDILEGEGWEDTSGFTPELMNNVLAIATALEQEYSATAAEQLASGARTSDQLLDSYAGPRRYAAIEAEEVQRDRPGYVPPRSKRIGELKRRSLDIPIREAEQALAAAQATGDPAAIQAAQDKLDEANMVQMSRRVELGEIRESSYRAAQGIEAGYANAAAARLFTALKNVPGVVHPEHVRLTDELKTAKAMLANATTQADRDAAQQLVNQATFDLDKLKKEFQRKGGEYVSLSDSKGLGDLRGAVVKRDVAHSITGFSDDTTYKKLLRSWKELKTIFNVGTHIANVVSNFTFAHMEGLLLPQQPMYLKRALSDMKKYGDATRALAEGGVLDQNAVTADGSSLAGREMRSVEGLDELRETTRPETRAVLEDHGLTARAERARKRKSRLKGAAVGGAVGAAALASDDHPEDIGLGAAAGAGIGALVAGRGKGVRKLYNNEDNIFRVAIYLKKIDDGMSKDDALRYAQSALGHFRTRSPALNLARTTLAPFILYPAKAVPRFARQMIDHPWRYVSLMALWAGLNEYAERDEGEIPDGDLPIKDRTQSKWGYFFPGFTQLPTQDEQGNKGATDVARWTPMSGVSTGTPPGSVTGTISEELPAILQPSGPVLDAAAKLYGNVDPMTGRSRIKRDYPPAENIATLLNDASELALPPALGFHRKRLQEDIENRDLAKFRTDILGPTGLRPRFVRPGANVRAASHQLDLSLREMEYEFERSIVNNKDQSPERRQSLVDRYLRRRKQAIDNFTERTGSTPPADLVRPPEME